MDWYSWLSKSGLNPSLIYDYSLLFADNELEEEDIAVFDHEFLKSMGMSVAKHRLQILKLAKKRKKKRPVARLLIAAVSKTRKCLSKCVHVSVNSSAIVVMPKPAYAAGGPRWRGSMLKSTKSPARLMITDGGVRVARPPKSNSVSCSPSPMVYRGQDRDAMWDSMFRNMKPT